MSFKAIINNMAKENNVAQHRGTSEIIKDWKKIVEKIANDSKMRQKWKRYQKDNFYAEEIEYNDLINAISKVGEIFDN